MDGDFEVHEDIDELRSRTVRKWPCLIRKKKNKNRKIKDDPYKKSC